MSMFINEEASHQHSLETLNLLYTYDDFMESIDSVVDLGCGQGLDLEWWATRTTNEDNPQPLNINCTGVDILNELAKARDYPNITYQKVDFEQTIHPPHKSKFDILWCHNSFQYAINPIQTLSNWWSLASDGAMLVLIVPQTTNIKHHKLNFELNSGCFYHHTLVSLIYQLAVAGWDCKSGFFLKRPQDSWIHAAVYKSQIAPMDPKKTSWFELREGKLLPDSADLSVYKHSRLRQQDLILPWLDHSLSVLDQQ